MQRIGLTGTALAGLALALTPVGAGAAECRAQLSALLEETPDVGQLPPDRAVLARRTLRELATAARQLDADGHEAACIATLDAVAKAMTDYKIDLVDAEPVGAIKGADDQILPEAALDERDPRLVPLTTEGLTFTTQDVKGNAVFSYDGERVGEFEGLLAGQGGYATHAVIGHGGFWTMFDKRAAIPIDLVRWDRERRLFYIPYGEDELAAAPVYDPDADDWDAAMNDEYYASLAQ